jgi:hypothetical protein
VAAGSLKSDALVNGAESDVAPDFDTVLGAPALNNDAQQHGVLGRRARFGPGELLQERLAELVTLLFAGPLRGHGEPASQRNGYGCVKKSRLRMVVN